MDIDFPLVLVLLTFVTGLIYLLDVLLWQKNRKIAQENLPENERKLPWLIDNARGFFPVLAIVLVLRSFLVEPFQIPSGSMLPTLEVGDFILVNKYEYGLRLPVLGTKVVALKDPQRGDVMVFKFPEDRKTNYIKRVIGIPGDTIRYIDKQLYINDELVVEKQLANLPPYNLFEEQIGKVSHQLIEHQYSRNIESEGEWTVPKDSYFVMGDNRDNSNDSRFWGVVPDELVVGKAFAIWMQWTEFLSIPSFKRVGGIE
jgi:signal peptidase I